MFKLYCATHKYFCLLVHLCVKSREILLQFCGVSAILFHRLVIPIVYLIYFLATYQGVPPRFVMRPKDRTVEEGEAVTLYCAANGRDRQGQVPTVTWLKDGVTIDMA